MFVAILYQQGALRRPALETGLWRAPFDVAVTSAAAGFRAGFAAAAAVALAAALLVGRRDRVTRSPRTSRRRRTTPRR